MSKFYLQLTRHDGAVFPVSVANFSIGRNRANNLVIPEPGVSRIHARIISFGEKFWIRDENSASGVSVNSRQIRGQQELRLGDVIHIGSTALRVERVRQSSSPETRSANKQQLPIVLAAAGLLLVVLLIISNLGNSSVMVPSGSGSGPVSSSSGTPTQQQVQTVNPSSSVSSISSRQDARSAVIKIESTGSFADIESGEIVGGVYGSGFIIDPAGIAVTNNHVVAGASEISVWIGGDQSKKYSAEILGTSECFDLAVIDIEGTGFHYLNWYHDQIVLELPVYAAGYPLGEPQYTITSGAISRESSFGDTPHSSIPYALMHTADITSGNSGGPLLSEGGLVVGINYAGRVYDNQYFAISSEIAIPVIDTLKSGQDLDSLGINGEVFVMDIDDEPLSGIWVSSVKSGSKASQVGLKSGDIIVGLDDSEIGADGTLVDYCNLIRSADLDNQLIPILVFRLATEEILWGEINGQELERVED